MARGPAARNAGGSAPRVAALVRAARSTKVERAFGPSRSTPSSSSSARFGWKKGPYERNRRTPRARCGAPLTCGIATRALAQLRELRAVVLEHDAGHPPAIVGSKRNGAAARIHVVLGVAERRGGLRVELVFSFRGLADDVVASALDLEDDGGRAVTADELREIVPDTRTSGTSSFGSTFMNSSSRARSAVVRRQQQRLLSKSPQREGVFPICSYTRPE